MNLMKGLAFGDPQSGKNQRPLWLNSCKTITEKDSLLLRSLTTQLAEVGGRVSTLTGAKARKWAQGHWGGDQEDIIYVLFISMGLWKKSVILVSYHCCDKLPQI